MASVTSNSPKTLTVRETADALRAGRLVVVPTETVFGIASMASSGEAVASLWAIGGEGAERQALAWHIESGSRLLETLEGADRRLSPVQRRLVDKLCPGPLLLAIELDAGEIESVRSALGVGAGVLDEDGVLLVRIVANPQTQRAIGEAGVPVIVRSIPGGGNARSVGEIARAVDRMGASDKVVGVLESDSRPLGKGSTLVRFLRSGGYRVDREGAYAERYIDKQIMRTILFVCTGNTCRSPMAAAIARDLIEREPLDLPTTVRSAGAFTSGGMPATPEAVTAVESLGVDMGSHQSSVLTREMISQADEIYGLTRSHVEAIRAIDPNAGDKVKLLDPDGQDVTDPIGQAQGVYDETAKRLRELIQRRLDAMRSAGKGGAGR